MTLTTNVKQQNYNLRDFGDLLSKEIMLSLNCHAIGTIQAFDDTTQTVTVTINYKKTFMRLLNDPLRPGNGTYVPVQTDYPVLIDCPILFPQGGKAALTMPIAAGDSCLIFFNDRDMDAWISSGQVGPVATQRLHSFSDGIAFVGLRDFTRSLSAYDTDRAVLLNDKAKVAVGPELVEISNELTSLGVILTDLMTTLTTLLTAMSSATPATVVATIAVPSAAAVTSIATINTLIGELLE